MIVPEDGSVELVLRGADRTWLLRLNNATNLPVPGIVLEDVGLNAVLQLFAECTNRSLLRWPSLSASSFSLRVPVKDQAGAARVLAQALAVKELSIIPDGEKFLMIVPKSEAATVKPHAPPGKNSPGGSSTAGPELIAPGVIDFRSANISQVAAIYAAMAGSTVDLGDLPIVNETITFRTQTRLTKEEALYAIETSLRWSGIRLVPVGKDKLRAVRDREP
jgi:hypothetical protein